MACLIRAPEGRPVSKERLHVGLSADVEPMTELKIVDVIICKVRAKLKPYNPEGRCCIETVWGRGYRLSEDFHRELRKTCLVAQ